MAAMDLLAQYEVEHQIGVSIIAEPHQIPDNVTWMGSLRCTVAIYYNYDHVKFAGILHKKDRYSVVVKWKDFSVIACYISPNADDREYSRFLNKLDSIIMGCWEVPTYNNCGRL